MKNTLWACLTALLFQANGLQAQQIAPEAPKGFDVLQSTIAHGKIDTIVYESKTVGTSRKALVYTPLVSIKKRNTLCYICCMVSEAMKRSGLMAVNLK
jgi:hypothetical protein